MPDITSASINPDGWSIDVLITGYAGSAGLVNYDFGTPELGSGNLSLLITSEGYNSSGVLGTMTRTVYGTKAVRLPSPNEALLDETDSGGDLLVRISLSDYVYTDDKNGGAGTSGTDPVLTTLAGWANNGTDIDATTNLNCTNNSAAAYPSIIGQWDWATTKAWMRQESDFDMAFRARHGFGVSAVILTATGAISAHTNSSTQTAITLKGPEQNGLYHESYSASIPITGYTQGEQIDLRAVAYPIVGDESCILDTDTNILINDEVRGLTATSVLCDKTGAIKDYAVVSTTGDDGTGAKSTNLATADTTPYLTVGAALTSGATVIYVRSGSHSVLGTAVGAVPVRNYFTTIQEHPDDAGAILVIDGTVKPYKTKRLLFKNLNISNAGAGWLDGEASERMLMFRDCSFNNTATPTVGLGYRSKSCFFVGCTGLGTDYYLSFSSAQNAYSFTASSFSSNASIDPFYTFIACDSSSDVLKLTDKADANIAPDQNNIMIEHNLILEQVGNGSNTGIRLFEGRSSDAADIAITGNISEVKGITTSNTLLYLGADSSITPLIKNLILSHNSIVGERSNLFYNESGALSLFRKNIWVKNNAFRSHNIKTDTFGTADGNRIGNWAQVYGVGYSDNVYDGTASASFTAEYDGLNVQYYLAKDSVFGTIEYVNDAGTDGTGLGNGDYTPAVGSVLSGHSFISKVATYDQSGALFDDSIGALEATPAIVNGSASGLLANITINQLTGLASGSASATSNLSNVSLSVISGSAKASASTSATLKDITVSAITGSASANGVASGFIANIATSTLTANANGSASIIVALADVSISTVSGSASSGDGINGEASGNLADISVTFYTKRTARDILKENNTLLRFIKNHGSDVSEISKISISDKILSTNPESYDANTVGGKINRLDYLKHVLFLNTESTQASKGTQKDPFNSVSDLIDFAESNGIKSVFLQSELELPVNRNIKNFVFTGIGLQKFVCSGQDLTNTEYNHIKFEGQFAGSIIATDCYITGINTTLNGQYGNCTLGDSFIIPNGGDALIQNSSSKGEGFTKPSFDVGGIAGTAILEIAGHNGGATIKNCNQISDEVRFIGNAIVELDSSCTDGKIVIIGLIKPIDNSGAGCDVTWLNVNAEELKDMHLADMGRRKTVGLVDTIYNDDGITPRKSFDITKDGDGIVIEITPQ